MAKNDDEYTLFNLNTRNIKFGSNVDNLAPIPEKTGKDMVSLLRSIETAVRGATGDKNFRLAMPKPDKDGFYDIAFAVESKYKDFVNDVLRNLGSSKPDLFGKVPSAEDGTDAVSLFTNSIVMTKARELVMTPELYGNKAKLEYINKTRENNGKIEFNEDGSITARMYFPSSKKSKLGKMSDEELTKMLNASIYKDAFDLSKASSPPSNPPNNPPDKNFDVKHTKRIITKIAGILITISTFVGRIINIMLNDAKKTYALNATAGSLGMGLGQAYGYNLFDLNKGLPEGTTMGAIGAIQSMFGDVTSLDTKALETLARVMGANVNEMVESGMGGTNPDKLLEHIMDSFFQRYLRGENSLGQNVGQDKARRELISVLNKISPQLGALFSRWTTDYSSEGAYKGRSDTWADYAKVRTITNTIDLHSIELLGSVSEALKAKFVDLGNAITAHLAPALLKFSEWVLNLHIGESKDEKKADYAYNKTITAKRKAELEADQKEAESYIKKNIMPKLEEAGITTMQDLDSALIGSHGFFDSDVAKLYASGAIDYETMQRLVMWQKRKALIQSATDNINSKKSSDMSWSLSDYFLGTQVKATMDEGFVDSYGDNQLDALEESLYNIITRNDKKLLGDYDKVGYVSAKSLFHKFFTEGKTSPEHFLTNIRAYLATSKKLGSLANMNDEELQAELANRGLDLTNYTWDIKDKELEHIIVNAYAKSIEDDANARMYGFKNKLKASEYHSNYAEDFAEHPELLGYQTYNAGTQITTANANHSFTGDITSSVALNLNFNGKTVYSGKMNVGNGGVVDMFKDVDMSYLIDNSYIGT